MTPQELWIFLPFGYLLSIAIETPILLIGLSARHSWKRRLFAGLWLTACTYPIVVLVLPMFFDVQEQRTLYLLVAETFAPVAECALFGTAFGTREWWGSRSMWRDFLVITLANLASFGAGELSRGVGPWTVPEGALPPLGGASIQEGYARGRRPFRASSLVSQPRQESRYAIPPPHQGPSQVPLQALSQVPEAGAPASETLPHLPSTTQTQVTIGGDALAP